MSTPEAIASSMVAKWFTEAKYKEAPNEMMRDVADAIQAEREELDSRTEAYVFMCELNEKRMETIASLREALEASCVCGAVEARKPVMIPAGMTTTWEFCTACKALAATEDTQNG